MSHDKEVEALLNGLTLKPPTDGLKQRVLDVAQLSPSRDVSVDRLLLLRCGAAVAACLAMVLLTHWVCERRLTNWTRPVYSRPRPQQDTSVLEELGWGLDASRLIRLSRQSTPERSRGAGQVRFQLQQLLNESHPAHLDEPRGDPPNGQSRHHRIGYAIGNA
jgi:hypothetical protein